MSLLRFFFPVPIRVERFSNSEGPEHAGRRRIPSHLGLLAVLLVCGVWFPLEADDERPEIRVDFFVAVDCPIANSYAPEINRLHEVFSHRGVRFRLVYPEATLKDREVKRHRKEYALRPEGVIDRDHSLVERAGATITPEVAVFDPKGELRYRGKIDNLYSAYGDKRRVATEKYLEDTLRRLLAGEDVAFREVEAIGCVIEPLAKSN